VANLRSEAWTAVLSTRHIRLPSRLLFVGSIVLPAVLFLGVAWLDYEATTARAREYVITTTNALSEQTKQALQASLSIPMDSIPPAAVRSRWSHMTIARENITSKQREAATTFL
jgi:hypothetical protein